MLTGPPTRVGAGDPRVAAVMLESDPPIATRDVLTPSSLNRLARDLLEDALPLIWLEGEISNFTRSGPGHLYFSLKDSAAFIRCAMFKPRSGWLRSLRRKVCSNRRASARCRVLRGASASLRRPAAPRSATC